MKAQIKTYWKYLRYVLKHKWFVFLGCLKFKVPLWKAIIHDWDKFLPDEWSGYADWFFGSKSFEEWSRAKHTYMAAEAAPWGFFMKDRFDVAWLFHQNRNRHHWNFWILRNDLSEMFALPMPEADVREMLADWYGAGWAITGKPNPQLWYDRNKDRMNLHPQTRSLIERLLLETVL